MAVTFLESGTDATRDLSFWSSTAGTVASDSAQSFTGPRSIKCSTTGSNVSAFVTKLAILNDTGRRISARIRFDILPNANAPAVIQITKSDGITSVIAIQVRTDGTLSIAPPGVTAVTGTTVLAVNTWYRISTSYYIANSTTFSIKLYINGNLEVICNSGTMSTITSDSLRMGAGSVWGLNHNVWIDDVYVDDGANSSSQPDTGNIRVTAKRPFSNGTTNGFTTQIGSGGSGYGTGHAPQVNEQPLSVTNGWSMIGAGSTITEEYNIEGIGVGDVNLNGVAIVDFGGWVYSSSLVGETANIILNGVSSSISLTSTNTMFTVFGGGIIYPLGIGTDIGLITSSTLTTVSLYECGILIAFMLSTIKIRKELTPNGTGVGKRQLVDF